MRKILIAALLAAASISGEGRANNPISSGNGLYEACTGMDAMMRGVCSGYISGVGDTLGGGSFGRTFCPPPDVTYEQALDIVKAGLTNHPEERQKHSVLLIIKYLTTAWPCPRNSK